MQLLKVVSQPKGRNVNPIRFPVKFTGPVPMLAGSDPAMNEEPEKSRLPVKVYALTPPTVPLLKAPGAPSGERKAPMERAGTLQVSPWLHIKSEPAKAPGAAEFSESDGPEIKKSEVSWPKVAVPVNVKLSARAEPATRKEVARE